MDTQCIRNTSSFGVCEALVVRRNVRLHHIPVVNKCHGKCTNIRTGPVYTAMEPEVHVPVIEVTLWAASYVTC